MESWSLQEAEREFERVLSMSEEEFRARIAASGDDPEQVLEVFDTAVWKAIAAAKEAER